jgi:phage gp29-like protein
MQEESVRLALLERAQENNEKEMAALREAISEISKVNVRISELLAVHQVKIDQQQQKEEDTNRKVETGIVNLTLKMEADRKELTDKMESDRKELSEKMDTNRADVLDKITQLRDKVFIGIGIGIVLNIVVVVVGPYILTNLTKGDLTNPPTRATVRLLERV